MERGRMERFTRWALPAALVVCGLSLVDAERRLSAYNRSPFPLAQTVPYGHTFAARLAAVRREREAGSPFDGLQPVPRQVRRGDTWGGILRGLGLPPADAEAVIAALSTHVEPRRLAPGLTYASYFDDGRLRGLELTLPHEGRLAVLHEPAGWRATMVRFERSVQPRVAVGTLTTGLEAAMRDAGADPTLAYRMADVLQWDLDFNRDLQVGDRFAVLYEEVFLDGRPAGLGQILAARYENGIGAGRGRTIEAYRFGERGFYDGDGRPLQKMFLRCPLPFSRITSRFTNRRYHPVLNTYRAHHGVDYGAPTGTPVRVTAHGVVTFVGWDRGGGKTVKVRHASDYETAYLHLSGYARGLATGRRVSQGDVIGYVGSTGLATGPHLDYRVRHRGRWIDPLSIGREYAEPLPAAEQPAFVVARDDLRRALGAPAATAPPSPPAQVLAALGTVVEPRAAGEARARR